MIEISGSMRDKDSTINTERNQREYVKREMRSDLHMIFQFSMISKGLEILNILYNFQTSDSHMVLKGLEILNISIIFCL